MILLRALVRVLALALLMALPAHAAEEGQRVILILDASGSMWGQIGGKAKIDIAKEVVGKIVATWKPQDELGLVAYGHREKGSCEDIEVLREPGKLDAAAYMKAINSLAPKGKTPMTQAVRLAAEALKYTEKKATVILVSDGIETCGADPCAVAAELEKLGVALTVHTVGFGLDDKAAEQQLKCLADETGGITIIADNADELKDAIDKEVDTATKPDEPPPVTEPGITFNGHVRMAQGVELSGGWVSAVWEFHKVNDDGTPGDWVETQYGADVKSSIAAGQYVAVVSSDLAKINLPVTIVDGKVTDAQASLEAGAVNFSGKLSDTQMVDAAGTAWEMKTAAGEFLNTKYGPKVSALFNAGDYQVTLSLGNANIAQAFHVEAGKTSDLVVALAAGQLAATAVYAPGGEQVQTVAFEVRQGAANSDGEHPWVATAYDAASQFDLPAGKYILVASSDYATASQDVEVKAGQKTTVAVNLNAGVLAVAAPGAAQIHVYEGKKSITGERKEVTWEQNSTISKTFNAGTYHLVSQDEQGNPLKEKDFEVKAGERTEGTIE